MKTMIDLWRGLFRPRHTHPDYYADEQRRLMRESRRD